MIVLNRVCVLYKLHGSIILYLSSFNILLSPQMMSLFISLILCNSAKYSHFVGLPNMTFMWNDSLRFICAANDFWIIFFILSSFIYLISSFKPEYKTQDKCENFICLLSFICSHYEPSRLDLSTLSY